MKTIFTLAILVLTQFSWSIPETNYAQTYPHSITPFYQSTPDLMWVNSQGLKLHYKKFIHPNSSKVIVIQPGRTDSVLRYGETMYDLYQKGFSIYAMDEQGQGESQRLLADHDKGHVRDFDDYVNDLDGWMNQVVLKEVGNKEIYFLGHSMGGAIGTLYAHKHPGVFTKMAVVAPMFEILLGGNTRYRLAFHAVQRAVLSGLGENYLPGTGPFNVEDYRYENNIYTHSLARFNNSIVLYHQNNNISLGGATFNWAYQALMAGWNFYNIGSEMRTPTLLVQAENDSVVYAGVQNEFCSEHPDCTLFVAPGSNHDALQESDSIRNAILEKVANFF